MPVTGFFSLYLPETFTFVHGLDEDPSRLFFRIIVSMVSMVSMATVHVTRIDDRDRYTQNILDAIEYPLADGSEDVTHGHCRVDELARKISEWIQQDTW
jgi:hypothetical protein